MLALPARLGGMGLINPVAIAEEQHTISQLISAPLVERILHQDHQLNDCQVAQQEPKTRARSNKRAKHRENARNLESQLSAPLQRSMELSQEKGASTWLTALPIDDHGFALHKSAFRDALSLRYVWVVTSALLIDDHGFTLHKSAFRDALSLRYGWSLQNSPSSCSCSHSFSVEHALSCKTGGFPAVRHNEVRDIPASLLTEVCHGVATEPHLQPLSGETMLHCSAITDDGARLDVAMYGFWGDMFEKALVDISVFNPCAQSNRSGSLASIYRRHEQEKKRQYGQRVQEVEHATFTPLVMSTTGGMVRPQQLFITDFYLCSARREMSPMPKL